MFIYGVTRLGLVLLAMDRVNTGPASPLHFFARLGLLTFVYGASRLGSALLCWTLLVWIVHVLGKLPTLRSFVTNVWISSAWISTFGLGLRHGRICNIAPGFCAFSRRIVSLWLGLIGLQFASP